MYTNITNIKHSEIGLFKARYLPKRNQRLKEALKKKNWPTTLLVAKKANTNLIMPTQLLKDWGKYTSLQSDVVSVHRLHLLPTLWWSRWGTLTLVWERWVFEIYSTYKNTHTLQFALISLLQPKVWTLDLRNEPLTLKPPLIPCIEPHDICFCPLPMLEIQLWIRRFHFEGLVFT